MSATVKTSQLGRYQIARQLGRGAMGVVYLANDPVIGRRIALKVLRLDLPGGDESGERLRSRFQREVQSAGILSHPNIVTVYDAIEQTEDGALCIAMEYVEGTNLSDILRRPDPLSIDFALDIGAQIADALEYAHGKGVIHRDIKPANVIVTPNGRAKITDFGIAHLIDSALSDDLRFLGTPSYMAPERIEGKEIDQRADLFSLGVVLYQLMTRHMPFQGASVADLTRSIARDQPTPPERYASDLQPELRRILERSLEKDPDKRYQDAAALATDLRTVMSGLAALHSTQPVDKTGPVEPRPAPVAAAPAPPVKRKREPLIARWLALAAVSVLLATAGALWWASRGDTAPALAPSPRQTYSAAHLAALNQGVLRLAAGDNVAAAELLRSAEILNGDSARATLWRELAEDRLERDRLALLEIEILEAIESGRAELSAGRLTAARDFLETARNLDPEHTSVTDLASRVWLVQQQRQAATPAPVEVPVEVPPTPTVVEPQVVTVEPLPVPTSATLELDFFSQKSRGVITIYQGASQIYKESFRFVERRRLLPPKPATGSLNAVLELPVGSLELRVYLSIPGQETQVETVTTELRGGERSILRLRVDDRGVFTAFFR